MMLKIDTQNITAQQNKGTCLFAIGHYEEAIDCFETVLKFNPSAVDALYNKALAEMKAG